MKTVTMVITPDMAKQWLENNPNNRPIKARRVATLIRDIKNGNFVHTHQGIAFDENGALLDGQHRLTAIAMSGIPVTMEVTFGMPKEFMVYVDTGSLRSVADALTIGELYADEPALRKNACIAMVKNMLRYGYCDTITFSNAEMAKVIEHYKDEILAVWSCTNSSKNGLSAPIRAAGLAAVINGEKAEDIRLFFQVFSSGDVRGTFGTNTPAAFNFARYILKAKSNRLTIAKGKQYLMAQNAIYQFIRGTSQNVSGNMQNDRYPVREQIAQILKEEE